MAAYDDLVAQVDRSVQSLLGGEAVVYAPSVGLPVSITGVFDSNYVIAKGDQMAGVETLGPAVFFRVEDLPADPETDDPTLTIRAVNYRVIERHPDDMGGIVLELRRIT